MRVNSLDDLDSEDDYINYITNMTIGNITREEESDIEEEKTMSYFRHKMSSLEDSFIKVKRRKKDYSSLDLEKRDRDFLIDLIKTLFKEVSDVSDHSLKIYTKNLNKTEKIRKITTIHKELYEKYTGLKMNYKSLIKQTEYKEKQISDLESLIKACDLEIFSLQSRIAEMTNFFQINKNNMHKVSNWAFKEDADCTLRKIINDFEEKKSLCDDMNTVLTKEKEDLANIAGNLRNNLSKKEIVINELKIEIGLKNSQINELNDENDKIKIIYERCKIKLETETKKSIANADRLKYLSESIRRNDALSDEEQSLKDINTGSKYKSARSLKTRYKSCINLDEIMDDIEKENTKDYFCRKKISFMNSKEDINQGKSYKSFNQMYSVNKKPAYLNAFNLSPTKEEFNEENCTRISEVNLTSVSILNQSQQYQEERSRSQSENSKLNRSKSEMVIELENSQDEHALGLIMSMNSETNSEEKINLSKIKRGISMTSSIDFVEDGLKHTKNRLNAKNLIDSTNFQLQMQNVNNLFINRRRSTKGKANGINLNSNNYNNIININFNNFENKNTEQKEFSNAHYGSNDEKYVKIYFDLLYESIKIKGTFASDDCNFIHKLDKEEVYKNIVKENIQFYNFAEFIQSKVSEGRKNCNIEENVIERDGCGDEIKRKSQNRTQESNRVNLKRLNNNFYFKKILKLKKNIFEFKMKNSIGKSDQLRELKISSEIDIEINFTSHKCSRIKNLNLQIHKFEILISNSTIQTNDSSNKEQTEQPNTDGLKTLYNKYFKYSDNFLIDTMKSQTPIKNFNHLFPNSKWNKYITKHNPEAISNGLVKYNKPPVQILNNKNTDQFNQKSVQSPMYINFMQTQYCYSKLLSKKNWNKD